MIHSISLKNYMSHADTVLELHPGMNAFIGESRAGKSTVIRAVRETLENAVPVRHISRWARSRTKKGEMSIAGRMEISIATSKGSVTRFRDSKENGYNVNGSPLLANKTAVPQEVSDTLNLVPDLNFAMQHDPHFFLSWSPPVISRYLNGLCGMEIMDNAIAIAISLRNGTRKELDALEVDQEKHSKALEALAWVDKAQELLDIAKASQSTADASQSKANDMGIRIDAAMDAFRTMKRTLWAEDALQLVHVAKEQNTIAQGKWKVFSALHTAISAGIDAKATLDRTKWALSARPLLEQAEASMLLHGIASTHANKLQERISTASEALDKVRGTAWAHRAGELVSVVKESLTTARSTRAKLDALTKATESAHWALDEMAKGERWEQAKGLLEDAKKHARRAKMATGDAFELGASISQAKDAQARMDASMRLVEGYRTQLAELKAKRPALCPTCGQVWQECKD